MSRALAIIGFCSVLAGCMPARLLDTPGVTGRVVSADGGTPIAGATVRLDLKHSGSGIGPIGLSTVTDSSGAFEIAPHKKWSVIILGADYFPMVDRLEISVDGYETTKADVHWSATGRPGGALGTLAMRPATPTAGTPWERYLRAPPSGSAVAVQTATYTAEDDINHRIEVDLPVLENEVAAGDLESIRLAVRLQAQFSAAAAIAEYLDAILGRSIRPNPAAYLQAVAGVKGCPSALPSGDLFVDRDEARIAEARARAKALGSISAAALMQERDECVAMLEGQ